MERGQLVCLTCGGRVGLQFRKPPRWQVPVVLAALVVALAVAGVFVALQAASGEAEDEVAGGRASRQEARQGVAPEKPRTTETAAKTTTETTPKPEAEPKPAANSALAEAKRGPTAVLSGVPAAGAAAKVARGLKRKGFKIADVTNAPSAAGESSVLYARGEQAAARALAQEAGISDVRKVDAATAERGRGAKLFVIVGARP